MWAKHLCKHARQAWLGHACMHAPSDDPEEAELRAMRLWGQVHAHACMANLSGGLHACEPHCAPEEARLRGRTEGAKHMCMHACRACAGACMHACHTVSSEPARCTGGVHACMPSPTAEGTHACMHACRTVNTEPAGRRASVHACKPTRRWGPACMHAFQCMPTLVSTAPRVLAQ